MCNGLKEHFEVPSHPNIAIEGNDAFSVNIQQLACRLISVLLRSTVPLIHLHVLMIRFMAFSLVKFFCVKYVPLYQAGDSGK